MFVGKKNVCSTSFPLDAIPKKILKIMSSIIIIQLDFVNKCRESFIKTEYNYMAVEPLKLRGVTSTGKSIGKGAYGRVIEVCAHGMLCAAKEIHSILLEGVDSEDFEHVKQSFLTECARNQALHHPNVVQMLGIHYPTPEAKLPWLVMEMMECSLTGFLEKYKKDKVLLHTKLSILADISQGLEFLHGQDIIHRDLSSNNVLLTKHCVAKLSDFGAAKLIVNHSRISKHTQTPGTLQFMPPEAISVNPCYGKSIDVFSLGCVTLHLMSHQWPQPLDQVCKGTLTALTEVERRGGYLKLCTLSSLKQLIESCLQNEPDQRPEIAAFHMEVKNIKADIDGQAPLHMAVKGLGWHKSAYLPEVTSTGRVVSTRRFGQVLEVCVHGTLCAAKQIDPRLFNNMTPEKFRAMKTLFLTECATVSDVHHPNVVQVLGIHYPTPEAKLPWLVMEMMETSLASFLRKYAKDEISIHINLSIMIDISQGLEFLHGQDIIHRDLSSNNILLTKHCVAKIADLELAKVVKAQTIHFLPPEVIFTADCQHSHDDKPVDVFSLACIACHIMSHQWPQPSNQLADGSTTTLTEIQKRLEYLQSFTESSLRSLVESCLHNEPHQRPDATSVCKGLKSVKTAVNHQLPSGTANSIEWFIASWQKNLLFSEITSTGKVIGTGAYGWVLEVRACGTVCAAKEIDPYLIESISSEECEVVKKSFLVCVTNQICHPNVVQLLGIHYPTPEAKLPWLVMEMMETSLTGFLEKYKKDKVPLHIRLSILVDIAQGLEFLHSRNIVHGNLTSNKVLLTKQYVAKIADLGVAKVIRNSALKLPKETLGILHFTAPEALPAPQYSKPVDAFSLGCIACHVMSHQWPEPKESEDTITEAERRDEYLQSCTPSSLNNLVRSSLHNEPSQRPRISAARVALEHLKNVTVDQFPFAAANHVELLDVVELGKIQVGMLRSNLEDAHTKSETVIAQMREMIIQKDKKIQQMECEMQQNSFTGKAVCNNCMLYSI